jgi:hypothetical protein
VPSWFFGDGSVLFNQVRAVLSPSPIPALVPLDDTLQRDMLRRKAGAMFGIRAGRKLSGRFGAEFTLDVNRSAVVFAETIDPAVEATRASFTSAFATFFGASPGVTAEVTRTDDVGSELVVAGVLTIELTPGRTWQPYAAIGGGVARAQGDGPTLTLTGNYQPGFGGAPLVDETDTLSITTHPSLGGVFVFGGGVRKSLGGRSGLRFDARLHLIHDTTSTTISTSPVSAALPRQVAILTAGNPSLIFSAIPGVPSSLSASIGDFETFHASGTRMQMSITAGYFLRF